MFTVAEAAKLTRVNERAISLMVYSELIDPEVHRSNGQGDPVLLGDRNLGEIRLIDALEFIGMRRQAIKDVLAMLRRSELAWWRDGGWIVRFDDEDDWFVTDNLNQDKILNAELLFVVKILGGKNGDG